MSYRNPWMRLLVPVQPSAPVVKAEPRMRASGELEPGSVISEWTLLRHIAGKNVGPKGTRVHAKWECRCSCGEIREVVTGNLRSGVSKSCGHTRSLG